MQTRGGCLKRIVTPKLTLRMIYVSRAETLDCPKSSVN